MFSEFAAQTWTPQDSSVVVTNNTDTSIDGSCKKVVFSNALNKTLSIGFTAVALSQYEEIVMWFYVKDQIETGNLFKITIDGVDYDFTRSDLQFGAWFQLVFDCSSMGSVSGIVITSLVADNVMLIDYIGYRKVTYNSDVDVITALKAHINLDYDQATTLSAGASAGATSISLTSKAYVKDICVAEIDNGAGTIETVTITNKAGLLKTPLTNSFSAGAIVRIICPVRGEDYDDVEPDPICGIKVFDVGAEKDPTIEHYVNTAKWKEYLGALGVLIYIDCSSKKKLLQMAREFNKKYGREFQFLLDGDQVDVFLDGQPLFVEDTIGNNPRMAYYYRIEPQPYLYSKVVPIDTFNIDQESI